jgi:hypothetical protein
MRYKDIPTCTANHVPIVGLIGNSNNSTITNLQFLQQRDHHNLMIAAAAAAAAAAARPSYENEAQLFNIMNNTSEERLRAATNTCNNIDYVPTSQAFAANLGIHDVSSLANKMAAGNVSAMLAGSNTRLTYSLTPSLDTSGIGESNARIVNSLHTVLSDKTSQLDSMASEATTTTGALDLQHYTPVQLANGQLNFAINHTTNSQFQSGIEFCSADLSSGAGGMINDNAQSYPSVDSNLMTTDDDSASVVVGVATSSSSSVEAVNEESLSSHTCASESTTSHINLQHTTSTSSMNVQHQEPAPTIHDAHPSTTTTTIAETTPQNASCGNLSSIDGNSNNNELLSSSSSAAAVINLDESSGSVDEEPTCKKQRIDTDDKQVDNTDTMTTVSPLVNNNTDYDNTTTSIASTLHNSITTSSASTLLTSSSSPNESSSPNATHHSSSDVVKDLRANSFEATTSVTLPVTTTASIVATSPPKTNNVVVETSSSNDVEMVLPTSQVDAATTGKKKLSFKEYRNRRSQKVSTASTTASTQVSSSSSSSSSLSSSSSSSSSSSEHQGAHVPVHPVSPAQKINTLAASLLLTPRTVSLTNFESRTPALSSTPLPPNSSHLKEVSPLASSNGVSPSNHSAGNSGLSEECQDVDMSLESSNDTSGEVGEITPLGNDVATTYHANNSSFEPVSENEYDSESPVDEPVNYINTIHSEITKNPFSIHNDITKNPFGKKQNLPRGVEEMEDDRSSTNSNISSTSYGSVAEVAHDRPNNNNNNNNFTPQQNTREYYPSSSQSTTTYYSGYTPSPLTQQQQQQSTTRSNNTDAYHNNNNNSYTHSSNQNTSRQRPTSNHRGYIPF